MHQYSKFDLEPYVNRYVWVETTEGNRLQAYVQAVDDQFVELVIMEDNPSNDGWERNRPPYHRPPNQPWQPYHRPPYNPPYNRPPYHRPPYHRPPYGSPYHRPPYYQQSPFAPFLLPLAALTAIGLLF
ncbi:hypothetical protein [Halolactibacillus miurensis]|uniref:Uncharacterized protein n=1 Tax=Halolactibacillus miurensis TaxID=306541 RepID=A0A1I6S4S8_9BACI|nr:hypothetical protein [Halolactibacillus miurensis]SFS71951.1 hypothetical protein SAMN05421668_107134 [Halolactibacillus miurensis]